MFSGVKLYALLGIGVVVVALSGSVAFLWQMHKADQASLALAKQNLETVSNALKQSEEDKALLARKARELDAAIKVRDQRAKELEAAKSKLTNELDVLRKTLPAEDQECLTRDLPSGIADLLRQ